MKASSQRFARLFFLSFAFVWLGVATVHILGNPDGLFSSPIVPSHGDRSWKTRRLLALRSEGNSPQIVILGSSRLMQMSPYQIQAITGRRTFNYAVQGATPLEMLAELKFLLRSDIKPELLIIGLDDRAMLGMYNHWLGRMVSDHHILRELPQSLQIRLWGKAITQIRFSSTPRALRNLFVKPGLPPVSPRKAQAFLCDNGYRVRSNLSWSRQVRPGEFDRRRSQFAQPNALMAVNLPGQVALDEYQVQSLYKLLKLARQHDIRVKLVVTPTRTATGTAVQADPAKVLIDQFLRGLRSRCRKLGVEYYDLRLIESFAGDVREFWDGVHPTPANHARIVNCLFGLQPDTRHRKVPSEVSLIRRPPLVNSLNTW